MQGVLFLHNQPQYSTCCHLFLVFTVAMQCTQAQDARNHFTQLLAVERRIVY